MNRMLRIYKKLPALCGAALCGALLLGGAAMDAAAAETDSLKLAVILSGETGDLSFYDSANEGLEALLGAGLGIEGTLIECRYEADSYEGNLTYAAENNDLVIAVGWEFGECLTELAAQMPETKFIFIDNALEDAGDNVMCITYAQNEGSYLAGFIAASVSQTGTIGVVGGEQSDTINDFIAGYKAGARSVSEEIRVLTLYANTYNSPAAGRELALKLYNSGCDVVFQVAGDTGKGVFEAAAEKDLYAIGVDSDQKYIDPEHIICSMEKKINQSVETVVTEYVTEGIWQGGEVWEAGLETGLVDVSYGYGSMPQQVSDELKAQAEEIREQIIAGQIEVPTAFAKAEPAGAEASEETADTESSEDMIDTGTSEGTVGAEPSEEAAGAETEHETEQS